MTLARAVDLASLVLAFGLPPLLIWRWRIAGAAVGALTFWGVLSGTGMILSKLDAQRNNEMMDTLWLNIGWLAGLGYSLFLLALSATFRRIIHRRAAIAAVSGEVH